MCVCASCQFAELLADTSRYTVNITKCCSMSMRFFPLFVSQTKRSANGTVDACDMPSKLLLRHWIRIEN